MPSESILSHFWELASNNEKTRLKAASQLLHALNQAQQQHDERRKVKFKKNLCYVALHGSLHIHVGFLRGF